MYIFRGLYIRRDAMSICEDSCYANIYELEIVDDKPYLFINNGLYEGNYFEITFKQLKKDYISIREFLDRADYVGSEGYRTKEVKTSKGADLSFVPNKYNKYLNQEQIEKINEYKWKISPDGKVKKDKNIILYHDDENMLIYSYDYILECLDYDYKMKSHLKFISSKYLDGNWKLKNKCYGIYSDSNEVITELYSKVSDDQKTYKLY